MLLPAVAALALAQPSFAQTVSPITADDMVLGSPKAKVTVIEYASPSCPHCAAFNNDVFPVFKAKYIDTGKVRYVFREFITQPASLAISVLLAARCAGKDKYFKVIDAAFHAQKHIHETGELQAPLLQIGKDVGLDGDKMSACLNDNTAATALDARIQTYINKDKVDSTPTFVIGDRRLLVSPSLEMLDDAIAKAAPPHGKAKR